MDTIILAREPFVSQAAKELPDSFVRALNGRVVRAADLAVSGHVFYCGVIDYTPTFLVKSQTNGRFYRVQGRGETWQECECPDNQRGNRCKHGLAVWIALRAVELQKQFEFEWDQAFGAHAAREVRNG